MPKARQQTSISRDHKALLKVTMKIFIIRILTSRSRKHLKLKHECGTQILRVFVTG